MPGEEARRRKEPGRRAHWDLPTAKGRRQSSTIPCSLAESLMIPISSVGDTLLFAGVAPQLCFRQVALLPNTLRSKYLRKVHTSVQHQAERPQRPFLRISHSGKDLLMGSLRLASSRRPRHGAAPREVLCSSTCASHHTWI